MDLKKIFTYPYQNDFLLRKQRTLRRELLARENISYTQKKIAILGGSTIDDIKNILELFLLDAGIEPKIYQSEYNKFFEDAVFGNAELENFQPEIVIIFTSAVNILHLPKVGDNTEVVQKKFSAEFERFKQIWQSLENKFHAVIIQNNFDFPCELTLGNLEATADFGVRRFISALNEKFATYAQSHSNFYLHDLNGLSARIGLENFHNAEQFHAYKFAVNYDFMPDVALNLANIVRAICGKSKKCLVLDLDNTLWGGIIGDDGVENIQIGHETPIAESFTAFQEFVLKLKNRGVILAVCSKNDDAVARSGFNHPDSVLKVEDFACFKANWQPKNLNLQEIAQEINIGLDSLVFIDDNPAERQIVRENLPEVAVPEVDSTDVSSYIRAIENAGYFEVVAISADDLQRNLAYQENLARKNFQAQATSYEDFLQSLEMVAEIDNFQPVYFDRIAQLTNKTNQFNLTTRRFTQAEIENFAQNENFIALYGRLKDKFGDNGLISVVIGEKIYNALHIRLWLMSCRVLKRDMEFAMLDELVARAKKFSCKKIIGYYFPTKKNQMVANLYADFGFKQVGEVWELSTENYQPQNKFIEVRSFNNDKN